MEEVDRLFECFKCGISPPKSAVRERKSGLSRQQSKHEGAEDLHSSQQGKKITPDVLEKSGKVGSVTDKSNKLNNKKQFSPVLFYGSPHGVPPKRPSSLLRLLREIHIDLSGRRKSSLRKQVWATFPKQDEAIKFMKDQENVRIFSYQDHFNGQRRFLVSTYQEFWRRYKTIDSRCRHHYEVIQEGLPCHLYFDLEFSRTENPDKDDNQMVDLLLSVIFEALHEKYEIQGEQDWVVELDSSTEAKFSRHLVLCIPKVAFKDNSHAGAFVSEICSRIYKAREKDTKFNQLFVSKDSSSGGHTLQLFVDNAVYSRNRCFRLALSSKAGKTSVLLPTRRFKCKDMSEEEVFMASLICNIDDDCIKLLVCKMELDCIKTLQFDTEVCLSRRRPLSLLQNFPSNACTGDSSRAYHMGRSPFPSLDAFIESIASIGNITGMIRCWYWFSEYGLMVYSMSRNRYCERIGREHKSNHIMYVVDLQWGLYYQKCYDPDCQGYRSPSRPIPDEVIPEISSIEQVGCSDFSVENQIGLANDDQDMIGDNNDGWWLEAIKVAENVEKDIAYEEEEEEDDEWWMEVEKAASQVEICHG